METIEETPFCSCRFSVRGTNLWITVIGPSADMYKNDTHRKARVKKNAAMLKLDREDSIRFTYHEEVRHGQ